MEAGYTTKDGDGELSAYQKQKMADEAKRQAQKQAFEERKAQGFAQFKDYDPKKNKSFAKPKYELEEKPQEKKLWGLF